MSINPKFEWKPVFRYAVCGLFVCVIGATAFAEMRIWHTKDGSRFEAEFLREKPGKIFLKGTDKQNFTLALLEHPGSVGWHWFKYQDNDPENKSADPSNQDSNKGIVTARFEPYPPLLNAMRELNQQVYPLAEFFAQE